MSERIEAARRRLAQSLRAGEDTTAFRKAIAQLEAADRFAVDRATEAAAAAEAEHDDTVAARAAELVAQVHQAANAAVHYLNGTSP